MKALSTYVSETLKISASTASYKYRPESKGELIQLLQKLVRERGNKADLNDVDTSRITDMAELFCNSKLDKFCGDISRWDVSNVTDMQCMFMYSRFCGDISAWDVSNVTNMKNMFMWSNFNNDISEWDIRNVKDMYRMFYHSKFCGNLSQWDVQKKCVTEIMFLGCPLGTNPPEWYRRRWHK